MSTALQPVSDPVQAHNLWKAGLLVNQWGKSWGTYKYYTHLHSHLSPGFLSYCDDWFILLED